MKDPQRCFGTTPQQAARTALSIRRSFGRPTLRESTFTWCRRTTTSISSSRPHSDDRTPSRGGATRRGERTA
jgi:hypothetical protein